MKRMMKFVMLTGLVLFGMAVGACFGQQVQAVSTQSTTIQPTAAELQQQLEATQKDLAIAWNKIRDLSEVQDYMNALARYQALQQQLAQMSHQSPAGAGPAKPVEGPKDGKK